jgi:hypothetical protein
VEESVEIAFPYSLIPLGDVVKMFYGFIMPSATDEIVFCRSAWEQNKLPGRSIRGGQARTLQ